MYTKDDKERILADFYASGLTAAAFSRIPGNPSRQCLRNWKKEEQLGKLHVPVRKVKGKCSHTKHMHYPAATKREACFLAKKGMGYSAIARRLGITSGAVVKSWLYPPSKKSKMTKKEVRSMDNENASNNKDLEKDAKRISELESKLDQANLCIDALRELMCDPKAKDPTNLSNRQKAALGERLRRDFAYHLKDILTFLKISKSSYEYAKHAAQRRTIRTKQVEERVYRSFIDSNETYGYRRICADIRVGTNSLSAMNVSEQEVRRAMKNKHLHARRSRKTLRYNSYSGESDTRPTNVPLQEDGKHIFHALKPGNLVVTDVTEFKTKNAKVYLSPVIDCYDGCPVSWSISSHADSMLVNSSLRNYLSTLPKGHLPVVVHTDGGGLYRCNSWKELCATNGVIRSMSRKSCCPDNARAEGFFGTLKEEFYNNKNWMQTSAQEFMDKLDAYMHWYREKRLKRFIENDKVVYDTILGRRKRLGYAV